MRALVEIAFVAFVACVVTYCCPGCATGQAAAQVARDCTAPLAALDVEYGLALKQACEQGVDACEATKIAYTERYDAVARECSK